MTGNFLPTQPETNHGEIPHLPRQNKVNGAEEEEDPAAVGVHRNDITGLHKSAGESTEEQ